MCSQRKGWTFSPGFEVGKKLSREKNSWKEFHAAVICTGATKPRDLPILGRSLPGVHFAMEFSHANTQSCLAVVATAIYFPPRARMSWSIGGGDTGTDLRWHRDAPRLPRVSSSLRFCRSRRSSGAANNPWPEWPKVYKLDYGQEEAEAVFGDDPRVYLRDRETFLLETKAAT